VDERDSPRSEPVARARIGILVFAASLVVVLLGVELASRRLLPNRYFVWPPGFEAAFDAGDVIGPGVSFPGRLTINSDGFRGDEVSDGHDLRILAIGGSTTICVYLDDAKAWPRLLQENLAAGLGEGRVWVGNAGRPGHATDEHTLQVEKLLAQDPELDVLVLLVGVNDLLRFLPRAASPRAASDWSRLDERTREARAFSFYPGWDDDTPWYQRNFVTRVARLLTWHPIPFRAEGGIQPMGEKGEWVAFLRRHRARAGSFRPDLPDLSLGIDEYVRNLDRIADLARAAEVDLWLVTQPVLWSADLTEAEQALLWAGGPPWNRMRDGDTYFSAAALADGMDRYNEALRGVCLARDVSCVDAARAMPSTPEFFYDDAHFTERGAALLAELLAARMLEAEAFGVARLSGPRTRTGRPAASP